MAGITLPNFCFSLTFPTVSSLFQTGVIPAGKAESFCLMASLITGAVTDSYIDVLLNSPANAPAGNLPIIFNEPVRYRQPGGNVVLLNNFIATAGDQVLVGVSATGLPSLVVTMFNRWRFDA